MHSTYWQAKLRKKGPSLRTIRKQSPPPVLTEWRMPRLVGNRTAGMDCTYAEMRRDHDVLRAVEDGLSMEQGGICAYTGIRIVRTRQSGSTLQRDVNFHIEHLVPQTYCTYGQDTEYANLVACWPGPNCQSLPAPEATSSTSSDIGRKASMLRS